MSPPVKDEPLNTMAKIKGQIEWIRDELHVKENFGIGLPNPNGDPRTSNTSALLKHPRLNQLEVDLDRMEKYLALKRNGEEPYIYGATIYEVDVAGFGASVFDEILYCLGFDPKANPDAHLSYIRKSITDLKQFMKQRDIDGFIERNLVRLEGKISRLTPRIKKVAEMDKVQTRLKGFVANRIQRWYRQCKQHKETRAARIIQCWNRWCMFHIRCKRSQAATTIQRWRQSIINRRKQLKLDVAASSSALRDRGQPLPPINHRQRYRRNQRARRQRNSKRSRPSRKRGQQRGRPPNPTQPQQSQQQSIKRRENVLGIALSNSGRSSIRGSVIGSVHNNSSGLNTAGPYVLGRDLRRRDSDGRVTALGTALQSSGLSSKESVIGNTLHGNESSSRGNTTEKPQQDGSESHRSSTQPISSLKSKSSRRRRRRRRRRKHPRTNHHRKDGASTSTRHTPTYPSNNAHLSNISDFCDGIRRQLQQASSSDRNLLKFVCQLVLQTIDNQPTEPSIIDKIESTSTPPSVSNNPSSTINNELFSSINIVDSHTPKSTITTKLTELPCSVSITTEETTTRHEKPNTYLQALVGTTSNFG